MDGRGGAIGRLGQEGTDLVSFALFLVVGGNSVIVIVIDVEREDGSGGRLVLDSMEGRWGRKGRRVIGG